MRQCRALWLGRVYVHEVWGWGDAAMALDSPNVCFCKKVENLVKFLWVCHRVVEGSHRRLKCMLCSSGGLTLLRGRLGV